MKSLETIINETEMIDANPSQSGLGRMLRKLLKVFLGDYEYKRYDPNSDDFDEDAWCRRIQQGHDDNDIKYEKPEVTTDSSKVKEFLEHTGGFSYLEHDYKHNKERYKNVKGLITIPMSLDDFGKNTPYIVGVYSVEKKIIDFKCIEITFPEEDDKTLVKKFIDCVKKQTSSEGCSDAKITLISKSDKKEVTSFPLMKTMLKEYEPETSTGNDKAYYYTYTLKLGKPSKKTKKDNEENNEEEKQ